MTRQGKMHSSPFHVETSSYKYAIEHENDGYLVTQAPVKCPHLLRSTNACSLWNSGYEKCMAFKCPYIGGTEQRNTSCQKCAFFYQKKCCNPMRPFRSHPDTKDASFCCFFVGEENEEQYLKIKKYILRIMYTAEYNQLQQKLCIHQKSIRRCERELSLYEKNASYCQYLQNKLEKQTRQAAAKSKRMEVLKDTLHTPFYKT